MEPLPDEEVIVYKQKRGPSRALLFGCGGLLACGAICGLLLVVTFITFVWPVYTAARDFGTALHNEDYAAAYAMLTSGYQQELGSSDGLRQIIVEDGLYLEAWSFGWFRWINVENNSGKFEGRVKLTGERTATLEIDLRKVAGEWKITGFYFSNIEYGGG